LRIATVQGNDLNRDLTHAEVQERYLPAKHFALADQLQGPLDLVIFPESSMDDDPSVDAFEYGNIERIAAQLDAYVIANSSDVSRDDGRRANVNFLFDPSGQLVGTYGKRHLVPFGEYIPFRSVFGGLKVLERVGRDTAPGDGRHVWNVDGVPVGTMICFESAFSGDARGYARAGAEILIVTTNNRSYQRTSNSEQHVAMSQLRAAETGRPVVHAAISGISAFIDADGDVVARTDLFVPTTLTEAVTGTTGRTPYVVLGEWAVALAWLTCLAGAATVVLARRRERRAPVRTPAGAIAVAVPAHDPAVPTPAAPRPEEVP
jgi:apolipoprotein N-acyltransferase